MSSKNIYLNKDISVPNFLNVFIACGSITVMCYALWIASHTTSLLVQFSCFITFSLFGNTTFGLLHEAVHSSFSNNKKVNYIFGNILAAFFPTAYSFQKSCHLNHHRQNRTDYESFEYYHDSDNKVLKTLLIYYILTGLYWAAPPLGSLWLLISPKSLMNSVFSGRDDYKVGRLGGASMLRNLERSSVRKMLIMRGEVLFSILVQVSLFYFLDLSFKGWLICYAGFAIAWSGLQYADHAYSVRDIRNGAWNLKVSKLTQYFYLNYHHHLAHHQHPHVPWLHLAKFVDFEAERPSFWKIYLKMWKGPIYMKEDGPKPIDDSLEELITRDSFQT